MRSWYLYYVRPMIVSTPLLSIIAIISMDKELHFTYIYHYITDAMSTGNCL